MKPNIELPEKIIAKDEILSLRSEILESEKARVELLKYKLIAIASLATIGLGFNEQKANAKIAFDYVLCVIPFVCIYVDLLCYHNTIRILVTACFLNLNGDPYERYITELNNNSSKGAHYFFTMEDFALYWSSMGLSIFLIFYGIRLLVSDGINIASNVFILTGVVAVIANVLISISFKTRKNVLFSTIDKLKKDKGFI